MKDDQSNNDGSFIDKVADSDNFNAANASNSYWERDTIKELLFSTLKEQKARRRWGIFFKTIGFVYIICMTLFGFLGKDFKISKEKKLEHTAIVRVEGEISKDQQANAETINKGLQNAFANKQTKGVVLKINSPGGSPVQARQIYNNIVRLKQEYPKIKIYASIEDLGTSAAYLIASAADQIYSDETSLVGSIGVVIPSFGFVDALNKLGIERRMYVAGKSKAMLDPFSPKRPEHEAFILQQLELTHQVFIKNVIEQRPKLANSSSKEELFSGKFWVGKAAFDLGLVDGFGDVQHIASNIIKAKDIRDFTIQPTLTDKLTSKFKVILRNSLLFWL